MKLPLFPLSSHILPAGRMALRIFEPRYIRMIKQSCADDTGFVICMVNSNGDVGTNSHIYPIGTVCKVIDFDVLEDGLLGVTVEGIDSVTVGNTVTEHDELRIGECESNPKWICETSIEELHPIDIRLQEIFERYPDVSSLYSQTSFSDPMWVINRWIELLPVGAEQKQYFLTQQDCTKVLNYLSQLIE
ncbi:MAG: Lon protease-like protein [Alphaproteobacteria bacterium]|jgi:Lon protease-like protein